MLQIPVPATKAQKKNFSRKRQAILETIRETTIHPTAEWVYQTLKPQYPDLSLGTVYRNIAFFKEQGLVIRVSIVNGQERLDGNTSPHSHFICKHCGAVVDIMENFTSIAAAQQVQEKYGLQIEQQEVLFYGKCHGCQSSQSCQSCQESNAMVSGLQ